MASDEKKDSMELLFNLVSAEIKFSEMESEILKRWKDIDAFRTSLKQSLEEKRPEFTFYDGPPFATGLPHYGHILAGTIKDVVTRFAHQSGFHVTRRFGWDTHGLPVEYEIDKKLKIKSKDDVMKMGIDKYNAECRAIVMRYSSEWERIVERMGRWIDFRNDYKTLNPSFMESVWWVFKTLFEKKLVYRGFKVMPFSTGCHTPLSNFEVSPDCYRDVQDPAVVVSFPVINNPDFEGVDLLAWTTTPWTLPSNLAVCVGPDLVYLRIKDLKSGKVYIIAESCLGTLYPSLAKANANKQAVLMGGAKKKSKKKKKNKKKTDNKAPEQNASSKQQPAKKEDEKLFEELARYKGTDLVGLQYTPLFDYFKDRVTDKAWHVVADDYVTAGSGTGLVHNAPGFGEDDYRVCLRDGVITRGAGLICPVDDNGEFTDEVKDFAGQYVKKADRAIIRHLNKAGRMVKDSTITHSYPHCWRSDTPLIYRAVPSWFVNVPKIKQKVIDNNKKTYWVPEPVQTKRFHNWLTTAQDWSVSRDRFWGTPLPIWVSDDYEEVVVIGSIQELRDLSGVQDITDIHRDKIDHITIPSKQGKGDLHRVPQVFDCWFESGSMPYAQVHYPFENKEKFEKHQFPADFIAEGLDQTRGWFYTLMVISTALFDKPAFKNLIVNGLVLAEDGKKMSKRLKNYPDPMLVVDKYGADALRLYLINSPVVRAEPLRFKEAGVRDVVKDLFVPWKNTFRLFVAQHRRFQMRYPYHKLDLNPATSQVYLRTNNPMDKWILASLQSLIVFIKEEMKAYRLYTVVPKLVDFIFQLSNWYIRFNKPRLKGENGKEEAELALCTLYEVLLNLCTLMAPFTPYLVEDMYLNLRKGLPADQQKESVHFLLLPEPNEKYFNPTIENAVERLQSIILLGRQTREKSSISLRIPTPEVLVVHNEADFLQDVEQLQEYVQQELNCRKLTLTSEVNKFGGLTGAPNYKPLGQRLKGKMRAASKKIETLTHDQLQELETNGELKFDDFSILKEDVTIAWQFTGDKKKYEVAVSDVDRAMVLLDKELDQSCKDEGKARELMSRVQKMRKDAGLLAEDEIEVFYRLTPSANDTKRWLPTLTPFINSGINIFLMPKATMDKEYKLLAEQKVEVYGEELTLYIVAQRVLFEEAALGSLGVDVDKLKAAVRAKEDKLGRRDLRLRVALDRGLVVSVDGKDVTLQEGTHFHYSLSDQNAGN